MTDDHGTPEKVPEGKAPARWPGLQGSEQDEVVGQVDPQLVLVTGDIGAQAGMAQRYTQILEHTALDLVVQTQVAFPLAVTGVAQGVDVTAAQVLGAEAQPRHVVGKVVTVLADPCLLAGALELADLRVGDQVGGGPIAVVDEGEVAVTAHCLITQAQGVIAAVIGEQGAHGAVIHFTASSAIAVHADGAVITLATAIGTGGVAVEVAQVGDQLALAQRQGMHRAEIVLLVVVLELGEVVAGNQIVTQLGVTAGVLELVHPLGTTGDAQTVIVAPAAAAGLVELARTQGQVVDLVGGHHHTAVGLRQQATIVAGEDRQGGFEAASGLDLGSGDLGLGGEVDLAEFGYRAVIIFQREHGAGLAAGVGIATLAAGVQAQAGTGKHVQTQAYRTLGVTGIEPEHEALAPFPVAGSAGGVLVVAVVVQVAQAQVGLGVFHEAATLGDGQTRQGQQASGDTGGDQGSFHHVIPRFVCYCPGAAGFQPL